MPTVTSLPSTSSARERQTRKVTMRLKSSIVGWITFAIASLGLPASVAAQSADYYAGKTIRVLIGLEAGGSVDVFLRRFSAHLKKHLPGSPVIIVQNMPGAG